MSSSEADSVTQTVPRIGFSPLCNLAFLLANTLIRRLPEPPRVWVRVRVEPGWGVEGAVARD